MPARIPPRHIIEAAIANGTKRHLSPGEAATLLGFGRSTIDVMMRDGRLPYVQRPGSTHRIIPIASIHALRNGGRDLSSTTPAHNGASPTVVDGGQTPPVRSLAVNTAVNT